MMKSRHLYLLLCMPALYLPASGPGAAERMYKWIDANGNVQYSNRLPPEAAQH